MTYSDISFYDRVRHLIDDRRRHVARQNLDVGLAMTTTGRQCVINDDAHYHEPNEAPAKHTEAKLVGPILQFGTPDEGPLSLQVLQVNDCFWPTSVYLPVLAPPGHELVIRKVGHEIGVFRRRYR